MRSRIVRARQASTSVSNFIFFSRRRLLHSNSNEITNDILETNNSGWLIHELHCNRFDNFIKGEIQTLFYRVIPPINVLMPYFVERIAMQKSWLENINSITWASGYALNQNSANVLLFCEIGLIQVFIYPVVFFFFFTSFLILICVLIASCNFIILNCLSAIANLDNTFNWYTLCKIPKDASFNTQKKGNIHFMTTAYSKKLNAIIRNGTSHMKQQQKKTVFYRYSYFNVYYVTLKLWGCMFMYI